MKKEVKNIAASVKARLLSYAKKEGITFNRILVYYFQERFLYRVSLSQHKNKLVLKGGTLLLALDINKGRPTEDIDFLAKVETLNHTTAEKMMREVAQIQFDDGVVFHPESVKSSNIREDGTINALRVHLNATLGSAKGTMQIDIGFKDAAIPDPIAFHYPTLLDFPAPELDAYCWETVVAEKFEAMTKLYTTNSRLKDFYDILYLSQKQNFEGNRLKEAIVGTFKKRNLTIESPPIVFTETFMNDEIKKVQWKAFLKRTGVQADDSFSNIVGLLSQFLGPVAESISKNEAFKKKWNPTSRQWM